MASSSSAKSGCSKQSKIKDYRHKSSKLQITIIIVITYIKKSLPIFQDISQCSATQAAVCHPETSGDTGHQEKES